MSDELSRAIEVYAAAVNVSIAAADTYNLAQTALDIAWKHKEAIRTSLKPKE